MTHRGLSLLMHFDSLGTHLVVGAVENGPTEKRKVKNKRCSNIGICFFYLNTFLFFVLSYFSLKIIFDSVLKTQTPIIILPT